MVARRVVAKRIVADREFDVVVVIVAKCCADHATATYWRERFLSPGSPMLLPLLALFVAVQPAKSSRAPSSPSGKAPSAHQVLAAEYARLPDTTVFAAAIAYGDTIVQRLAARGLGRMERKEMAPLVVRLLSSPAASVRREAVNALAQSGSPFDYAKLLEKELSPLVKASIYESMGRTVPMAPRGPNAAPGGAANNGAATASAITIASTAVATAVEQLARGLKDGDATVRVGAARGIEAALRRGGRAAKPSDAVIAQLRAAVIANGGDEIRQLLLLALTAASDRDPTTLTVALHDSSAQVRRLAVAASREWVDDPSPLVRIEALRVAGTCDRAIASLRDSNDHVVLGAVDLMGTKMCSATVLDSLATKGADWRVQGHALVSLARVDAARASAALPAHVQSTVWQQRAYAANAAKLLKDGLSLGALARDSAPNVAIAAMSTVDDASRALRSRHAGLVLAGANFLKGHAQLAAQMPNVVAALTRLSKMQRATVRDPRMALLQRIQEGGDASVVAALRPLRRDFDPNVASLAAKIISDKTHTTVLPVTTRYAPAPFPSAASLAALTGATARMVIKDYGTIELALMPDEAPVAVWTFADLAARGAFNGLTWHRIVPNFVIQGGSPGADEYDGITSTFMRDEVGFARNARGSFGISTRGRDTGDGQIYINIVDNFRLDHDYTVFARMTSGLDVMDRVQEGAVISSVTIVRK